MIRTLTVSWLLTVTLVSSSQDDPRGECDLSHVEAGLYCTVCDRVLNPEEIKEGEYCRACYEWAKGEDISPEKAKKVEVCIKTCHACPGCGRFGRPVGRCAFCTRFYIETMVRARIIRACTGCRTWYENEERCRDEECIKKRSRIVRTCAESGTFPHTSKDSR
jgi:hypothetical protein